jgi:protein subunit release factor A
MSLVGAALIKSLNTAMAKDSEGFDDLLKNYKQEYDVLNKKFEQATLLVNIDSLKESYKELELAMSDPDLWADKTKALEVNTKYGQVKEKVDLLSNIEDLKSEIDFMLELLEDDNDESLVSDLKTYLETLSRLISQLHSQSLLTGQYD